MKRDNSHILFLVDAAIKDSKLATLTNKDTDTRVLYIDNAIRYLTDVKEHLEDTKERGKI